MTGVQTCALPILQLGGGGRGGIQYGQALGQGQGFAPVAGDFGGHQHVCAVQALLGNGGGGPGGAGIGAAGAEHVGLPDGAHASDQAVPSRAEEAEVPAKAETVPEAVVPSPPELPTHPKPKHTYGYLAS